MIENYLPAFRVFYPSRLLWLLAFIAFSIPTTWAQGLTEVQKQKIDPRFYAVLADNLPMGGRFGQRELEDFVASSPVLETKYQAVIYTDQPESLVGTGIEVGAVLPRFVTAILTASQMKQVAALATVRYLAAPELDYPTNREAGAAVGANLLNNGFLYGTNYKGQGVIVCIFDSGIDWRHADFRNADGTSRIRFLWDVTITATGAETTPSGRTGGVIPFNYGVEYTKAQLDDELDGTPTGFVREQDTNGHGTHVAGTAAGNGLALAGERFTGIAPEADLLIIKGGNANFTSVNQINGLQYARQIAEQLGRPVVINMSLGGQSSAHDGTRDTELAVDNFTGPGRVAALSAGNDGASAIHYTATLANNASQAHTITIASPTAGLANTFVGLETWFSNGGAVDVTVTAPNGTTIVTSVGGADQAVGTTQGSVEIYHNTVIHPSGHRRIQVFLGDFGNSPNNVEIATGNWTIQFTNVSGAPITYHSWRVSMTGLVATLVGADAEYTVGSPGLANEAITVGAYALKWRWRSIAGSFGYNGANRSDNLANFSSRGPRRDGVMKPDLTAPGQIVGSARSTNRTLPAPASDSETDPSGLYFFQQGTSMAAPVVAGCIALLLQQKPTADWSEIKNLLTSTATKDTYTGAVANNNWGHGKTDIYRAMISLVNQPALSTSQRTMLAYDDWAADLGVTLNSGQRTAVRISPTFSGQLTGAFYHISAAAAVTGPVNVELWTNVADNPGALIPGTATSIAANRQHLNAWNYFDLMATNIQVVAGTDYWLVVYQTAAENFSFRHDNSLTLAPVVRSKVFNGTWGNAAGDLRIRPVITQKDAAVVWNGSTWLGGVPGLAVNAAIAGPYPNGVGGQGSFQINNLNVNAGHTLTIETGHALTMTGGLTNAGTILVQNNGALLQTTGSTLGTTSGTFTAQRALASKLGFGYHFISSPVAGQSIASVLAGNTFANNRFRYDATQVSPANRWIVFGGTMAAGAGYTHLPAAGAGTFSFVGTPHNGNVSTTLTGQASNRFNLVGNPYPSPLRLSTLFADNTGATGISGTAWFWQDNNNNTGTGSYLTLNAVSNPNAQVAVGQGFFVLANSNSGTLNFTNAQREAGNPTFYRSEGDMARFRLAVGAQGGQDELWVAFGPQFTTGFEKGFDAEKLEGATTLSLSAIVNRERLAIAALPEPSSRFELPLQVFARGAGPCTFTATEVESPTAQKLFLEDRQTGEFYYLQPGRSHTLNLPAGNHRDRFYLRSASEVAGQSTQAGETAGAFAFGRELFVEAGETAEVAVYSTLGTLVQRFANVPAGGLRRLDAQVPSSGVYVVKVATATGSVEKRVWLEK